MRECGDDDGDGGDGDNYDDNGMPQLERKSLEDRFMDVLLDMSEGKSVLEGQTLSYLPKGMRDRIGLLERPPGKSVWGA